jgi:Core-2/I-Branching enzyme
MTQHKIAFLVLAHTDPEQLLRLCLAIGPNDDIFVHLDLNSRAADFEGPFPANVRFIRNRVAVRWADVSVVDATLRLVQDVLAEGEDYLRLVLLSGMCYPIKPIEALRTHFAGEASRSEIRFVNLLDGPAKARRRVSRWHFRTPLVQARGPVLSVADKSARKLAWMAMRAFDRGFEQRFPDLVPCFGSQWWALTVPAAHAVLRFAEERPEVLAYMQDCWAPDELFFHTAFANSGHSMHAAPYTQDLSRLANLHIVQPVESKVFRYTDLPEVRASDKFFVRKVTSGESGRLLDAIDAELLAHPAPRRV